MRILLDECLPAPMRDCLTGHECAAVSDRGWKGIKNGELLRLTEGQFNLFLTSDQSIRYQQNLTGRRIPILELSTNDFASNPRCRFLVAVRNRNNDFVKP